MGIDRMTLSAKVGCGGRASEIGRSTARLTVGICVIYNGSRLGEVTSVGRDGVERDRSPELELEGTGAAVVASVAVAEEAVVDEIEESSRVAGRPCWACEAANERGRVCVARSKPATAESRSVR